MKDDTRHMKLTILRRSPAATATYKAKMKSPYFATLFSMLLLLFSISCRESGYRLRAPQPPKSRFLHSDGTAHIGPNALTLTVPSSTVNGSQTITIKTVSETQILAPDRVRITWFMDKTDSESESGGQKKSRSKRGELDGITLVGTMPRGVWSFGLDNSAYMENMKLKGRMKVLAYDYGPGNNYAISNNQPISTFFVEVR